MSVVVLKVSEFLFGPGIDNIPIALPDADERIVGYAGMLISAILQTAGLYAQSEVLDKFTPLINSIGSLILIWCVIGAIISWALFGNYRESLYFLIGPALFLFVLETRVTATTTAWQFGDRSISANGASFMKLLDWPVVTAKYSDKKPTITWFFQFYDNLVSSVVQSLVTVLVDTKNKDDLVIAARERMLSRIYASEGTEQGFIELVSKGLMGECGRQVLLHHQLSQTDPSVDSRRDDYLAELDKIRGHLISLDPRARSYLQQIVAYQPQPGATDRAVLGLTDSEFYESAAANLLRQLKLDGGIPERITCGDIWKYVALGAMMIADQTMKSDYGPVNEPGIPWDRVREQVSMALVYDNCADGAFTAEERQEREAQRIAQRPKRVRVSLWMTPARVGQPGTFLPIGTTPPSGAQLVHRIVEVMEDHGGGWFTVKMPHGDTIRGKFDFTENDYLPAPDFPKGYNPGLTEISVNSDRRRECSKAELERISSRATEVVAAFVIRNTVGRTVFQNITKNLNEQGGWDPAIYRTVFGSVQIHEREGKRASLMWFAGSIPYIQGVLLFLLSMTFPFFAVFLLMPGKLAHFGVWMSTWLWVKSWDVGFAALFFFRDLLWQYMQSDTRVANNIQAMNWNNPDLIYSVMFQNEPLANMSTYFHIVALFTLSVPLLTAHLCLGAADIVGAFSESLDAKAVQFGQRKARASRRMEASMIGRYNAERRADYIKQFSNWALDNPGKNFLGEHRAIKGDHTRARYSAMAQEIAAARFMINENQFLHRNMLAAVTGRKMSYTSGLANGVVNAYTALRNEKYQGPTAGRDNSLLPLGIVDNRYFNESMGLNIGVGGLSVGDAKGGDAYNESDGMGGGYE